FFFFSSRRRHTRWPRDWSSDVCSSDLYHTPLVHPQLTQVVGDWNMQHDIFDDHVTRDLCAFAVCSPAAKTQISEQKRLDRVLLRSEERRVGKEGRSGRSRWPERETEEQ